MQCYSHGHLPIARIAAHSMLTNFMLDKSSSLSTDNLNLEFNARYLPPIECQIIRISRRNIDSSLFLSCHYRHRS